MASSLIRKIHWSGCCSSAKPKISVIAILSRLLGPSPWVRPRMNGFSIITSSRTLTAGSPGLMQPTWVFTSRKLMAGQGADIRFVVGDVLPVYHQMLAAAGDKNIWLMGGGELVGQFHDQGLLDEVIVQIASVTLGSGAPLLPRQITTPPLRLIGHGVRPFVCGTSLRGTSLTWKVAVSRHRPSPPICRNLDLGHYHDVVSGRRDEHHAYRH